MMADHQWKILLVEDDEEDYLLTRAMLAEARGRKYNLEWAATYETALKTILSNPFDAILMDYELGPRSGLDLTREVTALGCKAPIILLTGRGNYEIDVQAMRAGATDYLSKSEASPASLERSIRYAILQKQTEESLRSSEAQLLEAKGELEARVAERTREISQKNQDLEAEIAERTRIEAELAEVQRRLIDRTEAERRELARDLHDGPMQELYGLTFQADNLPSEFEAGQGPQVVDRLRETLLQVIQSLRSISQELRPPALAPYGLEKAIRSHAEGLQQRQPDLQIRLSLDPDGQALDEPVRLALYRIYQTAITNVIRHAHATQADIRLALSENEALLEIRDNGCGFQVPKRWINLAREGHLGLVGAVERAEAAGGKLIVESQPGQGSLIRVIVPLNISIPGDSESNGEKPASS